MRKLTHSVFGTFLIMLCAVSLIAAGQPQKGNRKASSKAAWEWTVEERIAARTDPQAARERLREPGMRRQMPVEQSASVAAAPVVEAFDGTTHPELFLPYQVFHELIVMAFAADPRSAQLNRAGLNPEVEKHGLPADFSERLEVISTVHAADHRAIRDSLAAVGRQSGAARQRAEEILQMKNLDICRSRADALAAARKEFGQERFDRFLYEVIAIHMFTVGDRLPDGELLRQAEEGCR